MTTETPYRHAARLLASRERFRLVRKAESAEWWATFAVDPQTRRECRAVARQLRKDVEEMNRTTKETR